MKYHTPSTDFKIIKNASNFGHTKKQFLKNGAFQRNRHFCKMKEQFQETKWHFWKIKGQFQE